MAEYFCEEHRDEQAQRLNKRPKAVYFRIRAAVTDVKHNNLSVKEVTRKWNVNSSSINNICSQIGFSRKGLFTCSFQQRSDLI
jgi:hypothetical protein